MPAEKKNRRKNLEEILRKERAKLQSALHSELSEKLGEGHSSHFENALDTGDLSFVDLLETIGIKIVDIHQEELAKMVEAERKLKDGTYGVCEICGSEISAPRLAARPFAIHCIRCAERIEGGEVRGKGPTL
ncbi:MAG: TraR/DksA family transcriptional regulator [Acidobacteriia bacterium]|nr:TraR/DksA family transcriptional regulator [Terriglobia bacterium]